MTMDPATIMSLLALATATGAGVTAFFRIGPQRTSDMVGAQDVVIENLREDMQSQRTYFEQRLEDERVDCDLKMERMERRYKADISRLETEVKQLEVRVERSEP